MPDDIYNPLFVQGLFDRMSRSYERMNFITSFGFSARWRRQVMALIERPTEAENVIDLMCGMGETWSHVAATFPNATLSALDYSSHMIEGAAKKNTHRFGGAFRVIHQDVLAGALATASFDVVVSAYGLKTFDAEQLRRLVDETARLLRPGGQFTYIEVTEPPNVVLRWLYDFYLSKVIPVVGVLLASDPHEYRMLWRYVREFKSGAQADAAFAHPLLVTSRRSHFFGCATSFSGYRI